MRMIQVYDAVAGVAVESEGRIGFCGGVYARSVTARALVGETIFIPRGLFRFEQFLSVFVSAQDGLRVEYRQFPVARFFQEPHAMTAAHEVFNLRRKGGQGRLFENLFKLRRVFALADCDAVRILRPARAYVVAVAKQAFIAVDEFRHGFSHVIAAPRFRVGRLLRSARLLSRSLKITDRSQKKNERDQLEFFLH